MKITPETILDAQAPATGPVAEFQERIRGLMSCTPMLTRLDAAQRVAAADPQLYGAAEEALRMQARADNRVVRPHYGENLTLRSA